MATKYQYKIIQIPSNSTIQQIEDLFNQAGAQGWDYADYIAWSTSVRLVVGKKILSQ